MSITNSLSKLPQLCRLTSPNMLYFTKGKFFDTNTSLTSLLRLSKADMNAYLAHEVPNQLEARVDPEMHYLRAPVEKETEVWAAGVTYKRSMQGRMEESTTPDIYDRVYAAERPELFFKANYRRIAGPEEPIFIRRDSESNVPEPELGLCINSSREIVGFTIGNDVSSRTIEGENPLYLPQAKVYHRSCALGPSIILASDDIDPLNLEIKMSIHRGENMATVWSGETNTNMLNRGLEELAGFLFREDEFPDGVFLLTGTCLVPDLDFTLQLGDEVKIEIENLGTLTNVVGNRDAQDWC